MPQKTRANEIYVIGFPPEATEQEIKDFVAQKLSDEGIEEQTLSIVSRVCVFTVRYVSDMAKILKNYKYVDFNGKIVHFTDRNKFIYNRALIIDGLKDNNYKNLDDFITNTWDIWLVNEIVPSEQGYKAIVYFYSNEAANKCSKELTEYNGQAVTVEHLSIAGKIKQIAKEANYFKQSRELIQKIYNNIVNQPYIEL